MTDGSVFIQYMSNGVYVYWSCSKRSEREVRGAGQVLQLVWGHKDLRRPLEKDGWKKTDFMVNLNPPANGPSTRTNGTYEDTTMPLLERGDTWKRVVFASDLHLNRKLKLDIKCRNFREANRM